MPELKKYYDQLLAEIEPISILTNLINLNIQIYTKQILELFGNNYSKIIGNIVAAFAAFRIDPVYHSDPLYFDHQDIQQITHTQGCLLLSSKELRSKG